MHIRIPYHFLCYGGSCYSYNTTVVTSGNLGDLSSIWSMLLTCFEFCTGLMKRGLIGDTPGLDTV